MNLTFFRPLIRKLVAALALLAMVLVPVAAADAVGEQAALSCELEHAAHEVGSGKTGEDHHDHHAHGCGSCHLHLIGPGHTAAAPDAALPADMLATYSPGQGAAPPGGLFRPPRP